MNKKKILIIDDSPDILEFTRRLLEHRGYNVIATDDTKDILDTIKAEHPDLVILDMFLSNISGLEICHQIKSDTTIKKTPILITTGHPLDTESEITQLAKPDAYLYKPFELEDLMAMIKKFVD